MKKPEHRCSGHSHRGYVFQSGQCVFSGKVERDGKWWCGTHDPVRVKERRDKIDADYEAKIARQRDASEKSAKASYNKVWNAAIDAVLESPIDDGRGAFVTVATIESLRR